MSKQSEHITDTNDCRQLWDRYNLGIHAYGVTGSYDFRVFYSNLLGMSTLFVCDDKNHPSFILPLSIGKDGSVDYFGSSQLEDTSVHVTSEGKELLLRARENLNAPEPILNINQAVANKLSDLGIISSLTETGTKVVVSGGLAITGSRHFSPRNMRRAYNSLSELGASWVIQEKPDEATIRSVFSDSIRQFEARDRVSKFVDTERQNKYLDLFCSTIPGIFSFIATCSIKDFPAIKALFLLCDSVATVSTITINTDHPQEKIIDQYGFRYAIGTLPTQFKKGISCKIVDFQGGNHTWKQDIDSEHQVKQYSVIFEK